MKLSLLRFALAGMACAAVCEMAGSSRLIGPFIASIGLICSAKTGVQRVQAAHAATAAYAVCAALGLLAHAGAAMGSFVAVSVALLSFGVLHALKKSHAPALALVVVLALSGASMRELAALVAMVVVVWAGGRVASTAPAAVRTQGGGPSSP